MFTQDCATAAAVTQKDAASALAQVNGHTGFRALRTVANNLETAVATYVHLGCAQGPTDATTRHACLAPAATIAQGFGDLRDGINLALASN